MSGRRQALIEKFRSLVAERLAKVTEGMATLGDALDDEALVVVERELHTLKGEAKLLGFTEIARIALAVEKLSERAPQHRFAASHEDVALMLVGCELMGRLRLAESHDEQATYDAAAFVERVEDALAAEET